MNASSTPPSTAASGRRFTAAALALAVFAGGLAGAAAIWLLKNDPATAAAPVEETTHNADLPQGVVEIPEAAQNNASLEVVRADTQVLPAVIDVTGVVAPVESRVAHVRPLARGLIEKVSVSLGARVQAGQPLVVYDNIALGELIGEYLSEAASLRQAETDRNVKQKVLERSEALIKLEAIAQQQLEQRRAEFRNAEAAVASQKARVSKVEEQIHRFGLSDTDLANLSPDEEGRTGHRVASHSVLRAPFAGVITKYDVAAGEVVEPERELFTIIDLSTVWIQADVYEKDLGKVRKDVDVAIKADAYPDRAFTGRLTYVSDVIDPTSRTAKVRCVVPNADGALKLDMFVKVVIPTSDRRSAVVVPVSAVQTVDDQRVVFVRQSATRFERRIVQTGTTAGDLVELASGVKAGEMVVGAGSFYLKTALLRERIGDEH
ncbi:MAG: efflux RND transporter periplasmic adaptor subunit [Vicinamibacterales bacterium]